MRGLQRVDVLANFGPPGTQHGTPEEEDKGGSIVTSMEEAASSEGRRRVIAMVVARTSWRRKHSQRWWGTHAKREREEGEEGDINHNAQERKPNVIRMVSIRDSSKLTTNIFIDNSAPFIEYVHEFLQKEKESRKQESRKSSLGLW